MKTAREEITQIIRSLPEDSTYDEILRELAFARMVEKGLQDSRDGKVVSNEEMGKRINSWHLI